MIKDRRTQNFVLGAGRLYFAELDATGNLLGEQYFGDTPGFTLSVNTENVQKWTTDGPIAELGAEATTRVTRESNIQVEDITDSLYEWFLIALQQSVSQSASTVTAEPIAAATQGRYYQLGQDASNPTGVRSVSNVVVTDAVPTTYVEGTDYEVDLDLGRIYIIPGGGIVDGTALSVDYDVAAASRVQIASADTGAKRGALRFIADNTVGENRDLYAPQIQLRPNGELAMKSRDAWQQGQFSVSFERPPTGSAVYIDGRAVA